MLDFSRFPIDSNLGRIWADLSLFLGKKGSPYRGIGQFSNLKRFAEALKVYVRELTHNEGKKGNVQKILREHHYYK